MSILIKNLTKFYNQQKAVDNISFKVDEGEIVGFLGPNGAGKSTTMKIATTYLPPSEGTVMINGYDVQEDPIAVRKGMGYLPEQNPLYLDMYVHEYLRFIGSLHGMKGKGLSTRVSEVVGLFGLSPEQNKKIGSLSKGYRQRVGLAQAFVHDPKVLILDEPTTGLDPNQLVEIRNLIKEISKYKTVIFSTHIMQEVQALCNRVIIIDAGKIVADTPLHSLNNTSTMIFHVEFIHQVSLDEILKIPGVASAEEIAPMNYLVQSEGSADIRPQIFKFASDNNKVMIGLKQEVNSLEKVFQNLTKPEVNV
ncbi:MAG: gliding motility-associated ABC transporter ATP-binding subunit GldA [Bacteroidota bacterium]|nr:gliding motility-associated ABC transporter ATP-binding subunit GldA [Bacteroidota bacterium]